MTTIELTRFRVAPDKTDQLLAARPGMIADFRADANLPGIKAFFDAIDSLVSAEEGIVQTG